MTPKQQYYKNIADTMISNLKKRGFEADYVPDRQAALILLRHNERLPPNSNGRAISLRTFRN